MRILRWLGLVAVLAAVVAACGGGGEPTAATKGDERCPVGALDEAAGAVEITVWHSMTRANEETLQGLVDRFEKAEPSVRVKLVNQASYDDTLTKYKAALGGGTLPDLVQIQDIDLQLMVDSGSVLPAQACIDATDYDLSDHLPRVVDYYTLDDTLWPMPFNVSNPVLYFDRAAFERAGLDPDDPPGTFDELRAAAQQVVSSGAAKYGMAIKIDGWYLEHWMAMAGAPFADHGNGRDDRASGVAFGGAEGLEVYEWLAGMARDGLAEFTPNSGYDNLFAIGNRIAPMTIETSASLGTIVDVLSQGQFAGVELGVAPMPGPVGDGGVLVGGGALYLVEKSPPERQDAAWRFARFLNEPQQQADWSAGTGYLPIRESATSLPPLTDRWAAVPGFKVAYDQLRSGEENTATAGPVIGDYEGVRLAVVHSIEAMVQQGVAPADALARAVADANAAIADYERRIGS